MSRMPTQDRLRFGEVVDRYRSVFADAVSLIPDLDTGEVDCVPLPPQFEVHDAAPMSPPVIAPGAYCESLSSPAMPVLAYIAIAGWAFFPIDLQ